jgi:hypothetical protein
VDPCNRFFRSNLRTPALHCSLHACAPPTHPPADGNVAFNDGRSVPLAASLFDGAWHMATVSSQPGGGRGYRLYVDGELRGEVAEGRSYATPEGFPIPVRWGVQGRSGSVPCLP